MSHSHFYHKDDTKDDIKEILHGPYNDSTNTYNSPNSNSNNTHTQEELTYSAYLKQHNASSLPITQGSDSTSYSYLESIKKAPTKKKHSHISNNNEIKTPTLTLKVRNNKVRNVLINSNNVTNNTNNNVNNNITNKKNDSIVDINACSPVTETSVNSEMSFLNKTDSLIINNNSNDDINEYDYKTFSSNHPIRFSKVKAFEQAEMTSKMFFSKFGDTDDDDDDAADDDDDDDANSKNTHKDKEIVIQIPQLSKEETKSLLGYENSNINNSSSTTTTAEKRIYLMKNAMKPITKEQLIQKKLKNSDLPKTFGNSGEFLVHLEPDELELWELMNDEFETSLKELQRDYRQDLANQHKLIESQQYNVDPHSLGSFVCRKVKDVLQEEDKLVLNHR